MAIFVYDVCLALAELHRMPGHQIVALLRRRTVSF